MLNLDAQKIVTEIKQLKESRKAMESSFLALAEVFGSFAIEGDTEDFNQWLNLTRAEMEKHYNSRKYLLQDTYFNLMNLEPDDSSTKQTE